ARQDLQSIYQVTIRSLEEQLPADFCCICLGDPGESALTVARVGVRSRELARDLVLGEDSRIEIGSNGVSRCMNGELVYEPDTQSAPAPFPQRLARGGLLSVVFAPLQSETRVFGILVVARRQANAFESGECEFLRQVSAHVAL